MNEISQIYRVIGNVSQSLGPLLAIAAAAGFGLSLRATRGKAWLAVWSGCFFVVFLWWGMMNLLLTTNLIEYSTYQKLQPVTPLVFLFFGIGWACLLLHVVSQRRFGPANYGHTLFSFKGRIGRQQYWISILALNVVSFASSSMYWLFGADALTKHASASSLETTQLIVAGVVMWLWTIFSIWPALAVQVKRWHDLDKSGWMIMINLIPIAGPIWSLVELGFHAGTSSANHYGENPLAPAPLPQLQPQLRFACINCGQGITAPLDTALSVAKCPSCQQPFVIRPAGSLPGVVPAARKPGPA